ERQLPVDAVCGELADSRRDIVGRRTGEVVVLHQDGAEVADHERLALVPHHVCAVLVPDARRLRLEVVGEPLIEDVAGQRYVVVGREHLRSRRKADRCDVVGVAASVLRGAEAARWVQRARWGRHHRPFYSRPTCFMSVRYLLMSSAVTCGIFPPSRSTAAWECLPGTSEPATALAGCR